MEKKTKIVATISDIRCDVEFIKELSKAGMNVIRMNTAHQTEEATLNIVKNVREVSENIALMIDTKGPELRTVDSDVKLSLNKGDTLIVKGGRKEKTTEDVLFINHDNFVEEVHVGSKILIDDGEIEMEIVDKKNGAVTCTVLNEGVIKPRKSVNVPNTSFSLPPLTEKDKGYIKFAMENDIDFIAHSFVRNKQDIQEITKMLDEKGSKVKIIAKIENQEGVDNIDEILENVYGIMVARGDLAIEIPYEKIPGIQKKIINKCIDARKPVIIATQMLHSMINNPRPTRAEVTDVANAIYSKTDAIMLSGETTFGKYPIESVKTMSRIALEVEKSRGEFHKTPMKVLSSKTSAYLAKSAVEASIKLDAKVIIVDSSTGRTLRNLAGFRGRKPLYAQCYDKRVVRELALTYGAFPNYLEPKEMDEFISASLKQLIRRNEITENDCVVVVGGNYGISHGASFIEISIAGNLAKRHIKDS